MQLHGEYVGLLRREGIEALGRADFANVVDLVKDNSLVGVTKRGAAEARVVLRVGKDTVRQALLGMQPFAAWLAAPSV